MKTTLRIRNRFPKTGKILFALGVSLSLLSTAQAQMNGTYTIDKNGAASSTNFLSFTSASEALQGNTRSDGGPSLGGGMSGAVVLNVVVASGPYNEQVVFPEISGSSSSNTLTINGNGNLIEFNGNSSNPSVIKLDGADYTTVKNLKLKPSNSDYTVGIWLCNGANSNTVESCDMNITASSTQNYWSSGISLSNDAIYPGNYYYNTNVGSNNSFLGNTIYGDQNNNGLRTGILLYGTYQGSDVNNLVRGNKITNSSQYGVYQYGGMNRTIIDGNQIRTVNKYNTNYFYGVQSHYAYNVRILNNEINYVQNYSNNNYYYYNQAFGVYTYTDNYYENNADTVKVINNTISGCVSGYYYGVIVQNNHGVTDILHNTIYARNEGTNNNYYYYSAKYGIYAYSYNYYNQSNQIQINIKNNIIDLMSDNQNYYYYGYVYNLMIYAYGNGSSNAQVNSDGNVMSADPSYGNQYIGYYYDGYNNYQATTLSDWQSYSNLDLNSTDYRPTYTDTANFDFTPTSAALNNAGVAAGVSHDRLGATRSTTNPDPGAIEFTATAGSTVANAQDATIYLNASGNATLSVNDINDSSTASSGIASMTLSKSNYDCSNVGTQPVVLTVTANNNSTSSDTATVTVVDNLAPTVVTKPASVTLSGGTASITASSVNDGSYDNCNVASVSVSPSNFDCTDLGANTVILTVTDVNGNTSTGTATVTVNGALPTCTLTATPSNNTYTGAATNQMFIGYGAQSMNLSCAATGGSGFSYSWSGSYLSGTTGSTNVFTPTAGGNYTLTCTVTNSNGCETTCTISICVLDIRSNTSTTAPKVYLCHSPNGNSSNVQTLSVSVNAVASHLSNHSGDKLGQCNQTCGSLKNDVVGEMYELGDADLIVYPNPSSGIFKITLESQSDESVNIQVYDASGKLVYTKTGGHAFEEIHFDASNLAQGIYMAVVSQGELTKTVKLTKVN